MVGSSWAWQGHTCSTKQCILQRVCNIIFAANEFIDVYSYILYICDVSNRLTLEAYTGQTYQYQYISIVPLLLPII